MTYPKFWINQIPEVEEEIHKIGYIYNEIASSIEEN